MVVCKAYFDLNPSDHIKEDDSASILPLLKDQNLKKQYNGIDIKF